MQSRPAFGVALILLLDVLGRELVGPLMRVLGLTKFQVNDRGDGEQKLSGFQAR